jgi:hypothetical protein
MNTENFIEIYQQKDGRAVAIAKSSIAAIEDLGADGVKIILKEKGSDGNNITYYANLPYTHIKSEINKWEKIKP